MHHAALHHNRVVAQQGLRAWAEAAFISKEEAAAQARKDQTWNKIQDWLAQDTGRPTNVEAITAPAFLQVHTAIFSLQEQHAVQYYQVMYACK